MIRGEDATPRPTPNLGGQSICLASRSKAVQHGSLYEQLPLVQVSSEGNVIGEDSYFAVQGFDAV